MLSDDARRALAQVDEALLRLRRLSASPPPSQVIEDGDQPVPMSTVLVLEACAHGPGEVSVADVASALDVEHSTASRLVDRAVRAGFVERARSDADSRRVSLRPTPAGRALRRRAIAFRTDRLAAALGGWTDADVMMFARLLARFADGLSQAPPPALP
jgi:DNA-binding MarR family transcriptional regulator